MVCKHFQRETSNAYIFSFHLPPSHYLLRKKHRACVQTTDLKAAKCRCHGREWSQFPANCTSVIIIYYIKHASFFLVCVRICCFFIVLLAWQLSSPGDMGLNCPTCQEDSVLYSCAVERDQGCYTRNHNQLRLTAWSINLFTSLCFIGCCCQSSPPGRSFFSLSGNILKMKNR